MTTPCPESKITEILIEVGCSGHGMVPGRGVALDVSYAVATTSTVAIVMRPTEPIASIPRPAALLEGADRLWAAANPDRGATFHLALPGIL